MVSSFGKARLKTVLANIEPLTRFLDHFSGVILCRYRGHPTLQQQGIQETARNTHELRYSLFRDGDNQLSLSFILTGDEGNTVLLRQNDGDGPGQVEQQVYRLTEIDDLTTAVQEKIIGQLEAAT